MKLSKLLAAIGSLSDEDKQQVKEFISDEPSEIDGADETIAETSITAESAGGDVPEVTEQSEIETEGSAGEPNGEAEETVETTGNEDFVAIEPQAEQDAEEVTNEPIPDMTKGELAPDEELPTEPMAEEPMQPVMDEQGGEMPVDYQQIIDGLNAKTMALEAENKQLKSKVEGAFGLTPKPSAHVPVNPLYSNTSDIPRMRR